MPKFEVVSSLGKRIRVSAEYWEKIVGNKHPAMAGQEELVQRTLTNAEHVRRSRKDESVFLHYRRAGEHFCCVVVKHLNGEGFVVTAYMADRIKIGDAV